MPISHAKSITIADATGTATGWFGTTTVTVAATDLQRPSDWNSAHNVAFTLTGNTVQNSTVSGTNIILAGSGNVSVGGSNGSIIFSGPAQNTNRYVLSPFAVGPRALLTNITAISQQPIFVPFEVDGLLTADIFQWQMSRSTSANNNFTVHLGIYTYMNDTQMSLMGSSSYSFSASNTGSVSGVRDFAVQLGTDFSTFSVGQYVAGIIFSNTASASANYSLMGQSTANPSVGLVIPGADQYRTEVTRPTMPLFGRYSTTSGALPNSVGQSQLNARFSGASLGLGMAFTIMATT